MTGANQLPLAIRGSSHVIESLDENVGRAVGQLLRDTNTSDVVDAHVVLTALRYRAVVFTSDPDELQRLATASRSDFGCTKCSGPPVGCSCPALAEKLSGHVPGAETGRPASPAASSSRRS